jgi:hypothetical protein
MKGKILALTIAAAAADSQAANLKLTDLSILSSGGVTSTVLSGNTNFWSSGAAENVGVGSTIMALGEFSAYAEINPLPTSELYTWVVDQLSVTLGDFNQTVAGTSSASDFDCIEGAFGDVVGAHLCGNYNFGSDFINDSSYSIAGSDPAVTIGGDDVALGAPQNSAYVFDGLYMSSYDSLSKTLNISSAGWGDVGFTGAGIDMTFAVVVPVPAAAWLFGSALIGLVGLKRKNNNCRMG